MSLPRRAFLGLLGAGALAGCSALGSSTTCSYDPDAAVDGWPLPGRDPQNTYAVPQAGPPTLDETSVSWTVDWHRGLMPIVVSGETLVVSGRQIGSGESSGPPSGLFALDPATGERRWETDVVYEDDPGLGRLGRAIAIGADRVYTVQTVHPSDTPNRLLAFDRSTGERDWVHEGIRDEGLHLGAGVVLASTDRAVTVVDPATGEACRTVHVQGIVDRLLEGRELRVRPAVVGDQLYVCSAAPRATPNEPGHYWLSGVDLASGTVRWTSERFTVAEDFPDAVVADSDRVYLPVGNRIRAFGHGGEPLWNEPVAPSNPDREGWPYVWKVALAGSWLVVELATYEAPNEYVGIDAASGAVQWQRHDLRRQPVVAGDVVYGRRDVEVEADRQATELHTLDVASGETRATYRFDGRLRYQPRIADGRLFATVDEPFDSGASMRLVAME